MPNYTLYSYIYISTYRYPFLSLFLRIVFDKRGEKMSAGANERELWTLT